MSTLIKFAVTILAGVAAFRVITVKPIRNYLLKAIISGIVFMIKRKLR